MHYDLTDLRLFFHVGEQLNLTRAAEKCFLSVPSASLRIKQLEENFQTPLMLRQAKGLQLTQAGEAMANHAKLVLQQLEVMHADLRPYALGVKGRIRLQANSTATNTFLAKALSAFLNDNPDIDIDLEELPSGEFKIFVPDKYHNGHEAHFAQVTAKYLDYLRSGNLPAWEIPNTLTKYFTTTKALELARK